LRRRPEAQQQREAIQRTQLQRVPPPGLEGDGCHGGDLVQGEHASDHGLQHDGGRQHPPCGDRRTDRNTGALMAASDEVLADLKKEMEETLVAMRREMSRTRTGRASTALLEGIMVEYYGAKTPLNQLAGLSAPEPRLLLIQPYDRSVVNDIER